MVWKRGPLDLIRCHRHRHRVVAGAVAVGVNAAGANTVGAIAVGAVAVGYYR
jgi:hypothetical protein